MNTFLLVIMLIICVAAQRVYSKSLFDYNINPDYGQVTQRSAVSYSNFRPSSEYYANPRKRYKHNAQGRGYGIYHSNRKHELPPHHAAGISDSYLYHDLADDQDYFHQPYHSPHYHHPHGFPPGQAKKHGQSPHGYPYVIPPRFPPPPVYEKNFLNPWTLSGTPPQPFIGQQPPLTTPRPLFEQYPPTTTPTVYVTPKFIASTTTRPPSPSSTTDDQLMYDIDVRFGSD